MRRLILLSMALIIAGCSSTPHGVDCPGEVATISGQPMGKTQGHVFDLVTSFSVSKGGVVVDSGRLHSLDRFQYVPSAVTSEGYYAQRLSDHQFRLINPWQDTMITWNCPAS